MAEIFPDDRERGARPCCDQRNIGDAGKMLVARNGNDGHAMPDCRECQPGSAFNGALLQQAGIFLDQIVTMAMTDDEIKVAFL